MGGYTQQVPLVVVGTSEAIISRRCSDRAEGIPRGGDQGCHTTWAQLGVIAQNRWRRPNFVAEEQAKL